MGTNEFLLQNVVFTDTTTYLKDLKPYFNEAKNFGKIISIEFIIKKYYDNVNGNPYASGHIVLYYETTIKTNIIFRMEYNSVNNLVLSMENALKSFIKSTFKKLKPIITTSKVRYKECESFGRENPLLNSEIINNKKAEKELYIFTFLNKKYASDIYHIMECIKHIYISNIEYFKDNNIKITDLKHELFRIVREHSVNNHFYNIEVSITENSFL